MEKNKKNVDNSKAATPNGKETEVLMTDRQYMENRYFQGRFWGVLSIAIGTVAEVVRVFFSRLLFNKNERLNITEIAKKGLKTDPVENKKGLDKEKEELQTKDKIKKNQEKISQIKFQKK